MSRGSRLVAVLLGVIGLVFAMSALVREAVLAAEPTVAWPAPSWWTDLVAEPSLATTIAAAATGVAAVLLIVLALRQLSAAPARRQVVEFGGADGQARLNVQALQNALTRSVRKNMGIPACRVTLGKDAGGWFARLDAELPPRDVLGVQERAHALLAADLDRLGGLRLAAVDVVVHRFVNAPAAKT